MCRWIAYKGAPIFIDTLVTKPDYSLVAQSMNSRYSYKADGSILAVNGDGFGLGWYAYRNEPALFKTAEPAWANENINEICSHVKAHIFMSHVRAASSGAIERNNAHPFKYKNWLFQHNGYLNQFALIKRDLQFAIVPEFFNYLQGTTDSEVLFLLALTYGLENNPKMALEKVINKTQEICEKNKVAFDLVMSCALSDGNSLYTIRFATGNFIHTQYYSTHEDCMKSIDKNGVSIPRGSFVVVSEPLDKDMEHWEEMPVGAFATINSGKIKIEVLNI